MAVTARVRASASRASGIGTPERRRSTATWAGPAPQRVKIIAARPPSPAIDVVPVAATMSATPKSIAAQRIPWPTSQRRARGRCSGSRPRMTTRLSAPISRPATRGSRSAAWIVSIRPQAPTRAAASAGGSSAKRRSERSAARRATRSAASISAARGSMTTAPPRRGTPTSIAGSPTRLSAARSAMTTPGRATRRCREGASVRHRAMLTRRSDQSPRMAIGARCSRLSRVTAPPRG